MGLCESKKNVEDESKVNRRKHRNSRSLKLKSVKQRT